jgi:putative PEP-CTERM system histidine kinase
MTPYALLPFAAALLSLLVAIASIMRKEPSLASWWFFGGMVLLAIDSLCTGLALGAATLPDVLGLLSWGLVVKALLPAAWLAFSLTYSRGDYRESLASWKFLLATFAILPVALALGFRDQLLELAPARADGHTLWLRSGTVARGLNAILLLSFALVLMHMEQTFRSAVGTMRWRIKYVVLGLGVIFGAQIFVRSQAILYSMHDLAMASVESAGLFIGCLFLVLAYARTGLAEIDVYPSRAVLRSSLTVLIVGGYLFIVGVLAQAVRRFGGEENFQLQAFVVLVGLAGLAVLLLSDRVRQRIHEFVGRHFAKAQHDSVRIWTEYSRQLATVRDRSGLCAATAKLVSASFDVLSVTVWLLDGEGGRWTVGASTTRQPDDVSLGEGDASSMEALAVALRGCREPVDLETLHEPWAKEMQRLNATTFPHGGHRWCVPLHSGDRVLGVVVLADRVNGAPYTVEERELLQCIADQMASVLANLQLAEEVARGRELEAFRSMSAFFVHDLKNATASLNLMLKNLPVHFEDPDFRADALRGIGNTVRRIDEMIARLSTLRDRPQFTPTETDMHQIVKEAVSSLDDRADVEVSVDLRPVPSVLVDREQILSVVTNLLLNARDALRRPGRIDVRTDRLGDRVVLVVSDTGCGMSPAFVRDSLFRPFTSTKTKGLGIGMFQSRMVVEAHAGTLNVESEVGKGTTVRVSFPAIERKDAG